MERVAQLNSEKFYIGPAWKYGTAMPSGCIATFPPSHDEQPLTEHKRWQWNGDSYAMIEDYRQWNRINPETGAVVGSHEKTPYWLGSDAHDAEPRYMLTWGPLPEGAQLTRPETPLEIAKRSAFDTLDAIHEGETDKGKVVPIPANALLLFDSPVSEEKRFLMTFTRQDREDYKEVYGTFGSEDAGYVETWNVGNAYQSDNQGDRYTISFDADLFNSVYGELKTRAKECRAKMTEYQTAIHTCTNLEELSELMTNTVPYGWPPIDNTLEA